MTALSDRIYSRFTPVLAIIYVLFIYSGAIDFLPYRMGTTGVSISRIIVYGFFAIAIALAPVMLVKYRPAALNLWGLLLICYAGALLAIMAYHLIATPHESGLATKSFIAAILHIWTFGYLFSAPVAARATRLTALTVIAACGLFILVEVAVPPFAVLPGRGSGFYFNPNIAALALLLGSLGVLPSLAPLWRLPFLAFASVIIFATVSRSGVIAAAATWATWLAVEWTAIRNSHRDYLRGASIAVVIIAAGALFLTLAASQQFRQFTDRAVGPVIAHDLVPGTPPAKQGSPPATEDPRPHAPASAAETLPPPRCQSWTVVFEGLARAETCPWLQLKRVERVQAHSSGEARAVLYLRSVAAFLDAPFIGIGLVRAHGAQTHNAFLFFGIAYGVLGLLLVPAFALFLGYRLGGARSALPFVVFLFVSSSFSHDVLVIYGLIAAWVIALSQAPPSAAQLCGTALSGESRLPTPSAGSSTRTI
jgi:O-Antigen ligase